MTSIKQYLRLTLRIQNYIKAPFEESYSQILQSKCYVLRSSMTWFFLNVNILDFFLKYTYHIFKAISLFATFHRFNTFIIKVYTVKYKVMLKRIFYILNI